MTKVRRIYTEKKPGFDTEAALLCKELAETLGITGLIRIRIIDRYDAEGAFDADMEAVFANTDTDYLYHEMPAAEGRSLTVETLPGQFDQHADSCRLCLEFLSPGAKPRVRRARVYIFHGDISVSEMESIRSQLINPVERRPASPGIPATLSDDGPAPATIKTLDGFRRLDRAGLSAFVRDMGLAMDADDLACCQTHFKAEGRDPTVTELRLLDVYWSDHCRHTTFLTRLDNVEIEPDYIQKAYDTYMDCRKRVYDDERPVTLMDAATIVMKLLRKEGKLPNLEISEEINACTVRVKAVADGCEEEWLLLFKNETHNHPTEIEPFGGAATCLGGGIRDPLSGRAYAYQAMRLTGAADPRAPFSQTLPGKLPQRTITRTAAAGYSSYGNQIGLAAGLVDELYHPGYAAKRMELGAVVAAAPASWVKKEQPVAGDVVILLGGRTGRDGIGGAVGSSKSHTSDSLETCGAEVQKGNAPVERMIQRLFRDPGVTRLIKRCNDFGAGGVSVAVGELADGLDIDLDAVPVKYEGLDGTEIAISESQERMAVVLAAADTDAFIKAANAENLEATVIAKVKTDPRMTMRWKKQTIVDLPRSFLNSNGAEKHASVRIPAPDTSGLYRTSPDGWPDAARGLDWCSRRGLIERFDATAGGGTVLNPLGGKNQLTPPQVMAALLPGGGKMETASLMSYGFDPVLSGESPFHGAACAVVESVAKIVAAGGRAGDCYLSFQEYFPRVNSPERWGLPFASLLGAMEAQLGLGIASVGGKDSMSGSFGEDLNVPPTLVSFATTVCPAARVISPEFKSGGHEVRLFKPEVDENGLPDYPSVVKVFNDVSDLIEKGVIVSAWALSRGGMTEAVTKMTLGNGVGFAFEENFTDPGKLYGAVIAETVGNCEGELAGKTISRPEIKTAGGTVIPLADLQKAWESTLEPVFPTSPELPPPDMPLSPVLRPQPRVSAASRPRVLIPVFPGTNGEFEAARGFETAGAEVEICIIRNLTPETITGSYNRLVKGMDKSQILTIAGGFSSAEGIDSAKIAAIVMQNPHVAEALARFLERGGLVLGIGGGFQALVNMGLLPGAFALNQTGMHRSRFVQTRVVSVNSPWMSHCAPGEVYALPISHSEGFYIHPDPTIGSGVTPAAHYVEGGGIESVCSPDGRVLGKMGHFERLGPNVCKNIPWGKEMRLFEAGVGYFR